MKSGLLNSRYRGLAILDALFLLASTLLRLALHVRCGLSVNRGVWETIEMYLLGGFHDAVALVYLTALPLLVLSLLPDRWGSSRLARLGFATFYFLALFSLSFDLVAEWIFWGEFGVRFNFIAVDYLVYTHEVLGLIWESFSALVFIGVPLVVSVSLFISTVRYVDAGFARTAPIGARLGLCGIELACLCLAMLFVTQARDESSDNEYHNELAKNGLYSLVDAFSANRLSYDRFYRREDQAVVFSTLHRLLMADNAAFKDKSEPETLRTITNVLPEEKRNVVLIMVESLSAKFLGVFGHPDNLTPNLDRLAGQSLLFRNLYATGTRTCRGMEAVMLSLPPTPGRSMVKRPDNAHLFSLGQIFKSRGYDTKFLYSGYGYFDNMNAFFSGNGCEIIDRPAFAASEISFSNIWGACDGDLLGKALRECDKSFQAGRPFFSFIMTVSNHRPYTYPEVIDIPSGTGRDGAVKYTDYALGEFLKQAATRPWFNRTVFVVVADHCASSSGKTKLPVHQYHIPLFFYAPGFIKPGVVDSLCSQIDVGPTLLGLLHFSYESKFFGQDVLRPGYCGRALLGNYQQLGLLTGNELTVLMPCHRFCSYEVSGDIERLEPKVEPEQLRDTISFYQGAAYLLDHKLYGDRP